MNLTSNEKRDCGFTMVEVSIVIAILAILAVVTVPKLTGVQSSTKVDADQVDAKMIATAISSLVADNKIVLTPGSDLTFELIAVSEGGTAAAGEILKFIHSTPKIKSIPGNGNFWVKITPLGQVTVSSASGGGGTVFYPK